MHLQIYIMITTVDIQCKGKMIRLTQVELEESLNKHRLSSADTTPKHRTAVSNTVHFISRQLVLHSMK